VRRIEKPHRRPEVEVDPERARLVDWTFEAYATSE